MNTFPVASMRLFGRRLLPLLLALGLVACGKQQDSTAASPASAPALASAGGELVFAFDGAAGTDFMFDPHRSAFAPHVRLMRSLFDSLVVALPGHRFGPWLATSWTTSADGRSVTFKLRQDVSFHDGTHFDAQAVKLNFDRIQDPKNAFYTASDLGSFSGATVIDDYAVRLDFATPFAPLLAQLSKPSFGIISPAALKQYGADIANHPIGTGPFKLASMKPGTQLVLERFDAYRWPPEGSGNPGPARLAKLVLENVPEEATRVAVLRNGQAQAADLIPPQHLVQFRKEPEFQVIEGELLNHNYALYINPGREPWGDARLRLAFRNALDLDTVVKTIYLGTAARAWSPLSPSLYAYDRTLEGSWRPDRAAAIATLESLGWKPGEDGIRTKDGKRLGLVLIDAQGNREKRLDVLTMLRRQLRDVGIELRIENVTGASLLEKLKTGEFDIVGGSLFAPDPDVLRRIYSPLGRSVIGMTKIDDPELTQWLESAYQQTDPAARLPLYAKAQHRIIDAVYAIPVYVLTYTVTHTAKVRGITIDVNGFPQFQEASVGAVQP